MSSAPQVLSRNTAILIHSIEDAPAACLKTRFFEGGFIFKILLLVLVAGWLAGCSSLPKGDQSYPQEDTKEYQYGSASGEDGVVLFGGKKKNNGEGGGSGIGVNAYLWRAALDTVSFMPLTSADPFGGVILTEWYAPKETPDERFKVSIYILDKQLRADGLKVSVFRQQRSGNEWRDAATDPKTATQMENAILTKARQLRIESTGGAS
jgi:Domain of unknown function (DUF3576)